MRKIHNVSEDTIIFQQEHETWFVNKRENGIEMKCEFITTDGYNEGFTMSLNTEESKSLIEFLEQKNVLKQDFK